MTTEFVAGMLKAVQIAEDLTIDRFGKLDKFQIVDAILLEIGGSAATPKGLQTLKDAVAIYE